MPCLARTASASLAPIMGSTRPSPRIPSSARRKADAGRLAPGSGAASPSASAAAWTPPISPSPRVGRSGPTACWPSSGAAPPIPRRSGRRRATSRDRSTSPCSSWTPTELDDPRYAANPSNRCYFCKTELWSKLVPVARARGFATVVDGTNADDLADWRPGAQAAREHGVASPLAELGFTKQHIRARLARARPSDLAAAVVALPVVAAAVRHRGHARAAASRSSVAEAALRALGVEGDLRVRYHDDLARVELAPTSSPRWLEPDALGDAARCAVAAAGFARVALDLRGFRSGSLNVLHGVTPRDAGRARRSARRATRRRWPRRSPSWGSPCSLEARGGLALLLPDDGQRGHSCSSARRGAPCSRWRKQHGFTHVAHRAAERPPERRARRRPMRLFFAIELGDRRARPARRRRRRRCAPKAPELAWVGRETAASDAEVPRRRATTTPCRGLVEAADRAAAPAHRPMEMSVRGVGAFPNFRRARVVWIGVEQEPRLELLHHDLELACERSGVRGRGAAVPAAHHAGARPTPACRRAGCGRWRGWRGRCARRRRHWWSASRCSRAPSRRPAHATAASTRRHSEDADRWVVSRDWAVWSCWCCLAVGAWLTRDRWLPKLTGTPRRDRATVVGRGSRSTPEAGDARQAERSTSSSSPSGPVFTQPHARARSRRTSSRRWRGRIPASADSAEAAVIGDALYVRAVRPGAGHRGLRRARPARRPAERPRATAARRHLPRDPARAERVPGARDQAARLQGADAAPSRGSCSRSRTASGRRAWRRTRSPVTTPRTLADVRIANGRVTLYKTTGAASEPPHPRRRRRAGHPRRARPAARVRGLRGAHRGERGRRHRRVRASSSRTSSSWT